MSFRLHCAMSLNKVVVSLQFMCNKVISRFQCSYSSPFSISNCGKFAVCLLSLSPFSWIPSPFCLLLFWYHWFLGSKNDCLESPAVETNIFLQVNVRNEGHAVRERNSRSERVNKGRESERKRGKSLLYFFLRWPFSKLPK